MGSRHFYNRESIPSGVMTKLRTSAFHAIAVRKDSSSLKGIIRMSGKDITGRYELNCLHSFFEFNHESGVVSFYRDALFFYGDSWDLSKNYFNGLPRVLAENQASYKNRPVSAATTRAGTIYRNPLYGYMYIPLNDLIISKPHHELLEQILTLERAENITHTWKRMSLIELPSNEKRRAGYLAQHFSCMPKGFEDEISNQGKYYRTERAPIRESSRVCFTTHINNFKPVGGIPSWAEEYSITHSQYERRKSNQELISIHQV